MSDSVKEGYGSSFYAAGYLTFVGSFDFMAIFLTIFFLWQSFGSSLKLYGFAFSSYDLAQFVFAFPFALWADKRSLRYS
jgi:MFS family permease